jgi:hypothetical protein
LRQFIDPELVTFMRPDDWQAELAGQLSSCASMIDMCVGQPDSNQLQIPLGYFLQYTIQVASRIDHRGLAGFIAPDQRTVLLKWRDWDGVVLKHGSLMTACCVLTRGMAMRHIMLTLRKDKFPLVREFLTCLVNTCNKGDSDETS